MNLRNLIAVLLLWTGACLHADTEALARFEPSRIAVGSAAKYIVEVTDSNSDSYDSSTKQINSLPIPSVDGLTLRNGKTSVSQRANIYNGRAEYSITHQIVIDAIPAKTGVFTIPGYTFAYKGTRLQIPAATLTVVERSADAAPTTNESIFLTLEAPEKLYVGQTMPITLKLYVASDVRLGDYMIEPEADGFVITGGPPEEPVESVETANGRRYRVLSWPLTITPVSSGKPDLNFKSTLIAQFPNRRSTNSSPFDRSIFDDFFNRTEKVNVYTTPVQLDVLPLPDEGQPKSFSGAIGQFNIGVSADTTSTRVNELIMLSLKLSGQGNFSRIQGPQLSEAEGWRSYPPKSAFEADSSNELKGVKRFDYIFVPEKAGTLELPEVNFSFFDPDVEEYIELTSPAIAVEVAPSNMSAVPAPSPSNSGTESSTASADNRTKTLTAEERLLTLDYQPKADRRLPSGAVLTLYFYLLNGGFLAILIIAALLNYRRRSIRRKPYYALVQEAREDLKTTLSKTRSDDAEVFFSHAQKAVRLAATIRTKSNLRAADFPTLEARFKQTGLPETVIDQAHALFQAAEACQFSGHHSTVDLSKYRQQLKTVLKAL